MTQYTMFSGGVMRVFLLLILATGAAFTFWWISQQNPEEERARLEAQAKAVSARIGVQRLLESEDRFGFSNIVITTKSTDQPVEFRAMSTQQGTPRPAFGEASSNCDTTLELAECWAITLLEIDGRPYPLAGQLETSELQNTGPEVSEETGENSASSAVEQPSELETTDIDTTAPSETSAEATPRIAGPTEQPANTLAEAADKLPENEVAAPTATHQVDRPRINARAGPSTSSAIVTTLDGGTRLAEIEQGDGWAQFLVLDGPAAGEAVWVALSIVTPVTP
ncbi:MAG: SH3 domain-containing protein [Granulosicoccus sp.]